MFDDRLIDVINKKSGSCLVTGPPGSGKTYTLLKLVKYLIADRNINPEKLLIFCFNRRWSKLIREKTTSLISQSIPEIPIETFYSFCIRFIEEVKVFFCGDGKTPGGNNGVELFEDIKILNSVQQWKLLKEVIKKLDKKNYPRTFQYINRNPHIENSYIQEVFDFILRAQENLFTPEQLLKKLTPYSRPLLSELAGIYLGYVEELKKNKLYNYGMLLEETINLLKSRSEIRNYYKSRYEYILVDELQEVNKAQFEIINYLSDSNCIYFGNDDQAIYTFRGSALNIFKSVCESLDPENIFFLDKNFRNSYVINKVSGGFINLIRNRIPKEAAVIDGKAAGELCIKEFHTLLEEANYICRRIKFLYLNKGIKFEDMAVIVKGLGYETHIIENALLQNGIPFLRRGTRNLLDNRIIKYILNFLRLLIAVRDIEGFPGNNTGDGNIIDRNLFLEPDSLVENIMLSESINLEPLYFKKIKKAYSDEDSNGKNFAGLWDYFKSRYADRNRIDDSDREALKISGFISEVYKFIKIMDKEDALNFLLEFIRSSKVGVIKLLTGKDKKAYGKNLWSNLSDFLSNVKDFCRENNPAGITAYISFIDEIMESKFTEEIEESTKDTVRSGSVNILSFHQCKGLEFKAVFIPFINKNYLPAKFTFTQAYDVSIFNCLNGAGETGYEELKREHLYGEMRLFYNGITRAKDYLYITSSGRRRSIFFEMIKDIYKRSDLKYKSIDNSKNGESTEADGENGGSADKSDTGLLQYIDLNNIWLIRKKALVAAFRMHNNLKIDRRTYQEKIIILKHFYPPSRWWDFIEATKNTKNPFRLFSLPFSYSSIDTFIDCPFKYKVRYYFGLKEEESLSPVIGKIYHRITGLFFSSKCKNDFSLERLERIINDVFDEHSFEFGFLKRDFKEKALVQFKNFFENLMPANPEDSIVEKRFSFRLNGEEITGRIDQINFPGENRLELVEYKSGSSSYSGRKLKEELQLKVYRMALRLSTDLKDFKSIDVVMKYIFPADLKKPVSIVPEEYCVGDEIINTLKENIIRIKSENFGPNPKDYNSCSNCGFKVLCPRYYG